MKSLRRFGQTAPLKGAVCPNKCYYLGIPPLFREPLVLRNCIKHLPPSLGKHSRFIASIQALRVHWGDGLIGVYSALSLYLQDELELKYMVQVDSFFAWRGNTAASIHTKAFFLKSNLQHGDYHIWEVGRNSMNDDKFIFS